MHPALYEYIIEIKQDSAPNAYEKLGKVQIIMNIHQRCILVDEDFIENVRFEDNFWWERKDPR